MRVPLRHGAIVKCDAELGDADTQPRTKCPERFTSYSMISVVRAQARAAGWGRVWSWQVTGEMGATERTKRDVCPEHNKIAKANLARRDAIVAERQAKEKAERELAKAQKATDKLAAKAARIKERADKAEARANRTKMRERLAAQKAEKKARKRAGNAPTAGEAST